MDGGGQQCEPISYAVRLPRNSLFVEAEQRHLQDRRQLEHGTDRTTRFPALDPRKQ